MSESRPVREWTKNEFIEAVGKKVFNSAEQAEGLYYTLQTPSSNLLLYGPGGYAKSMILEVGLSLVTTDFYSSVFLSTAAPGMSPDQFTGSLNVTKWKETGIQEYLMDQTVFLCGLKYGILEEGLSAPPKVLLALRDALQRGSLCVHGVCYTNTLENFFIPTNVNPDEWVKSLPKQEQEGGKALLDRFHRHIPVAWESHTTDVWAAYFQHQRGEDSIMAEMLGEVWAAGHKINPRTGLQLMDQYEAHGLAACKNFRGVTPEVLDILQKVEARAPYIASIKRIEKKLDEFAQVCQRFDEGVLITKSAAQSMIVECQQMQVELKQIKIPTDTKYTERLQGINQRMQKCAPALIDLLSRAPNSIGI